MISSRQEIDFYTDTMIMQAIVSNNSLSKTAGIAEIASELISKVSDYFGSKVDPNNRAGSVLNMLAPGAISVMFSSLGMPWIGLLFGVAMNVFHIDVAGILSSIWESLKSILSDGKQTSSSEVDAVVNKAVQENTKPATQEEAEAALKSQSQLLRDARIVKLALIEYQTALTKTAGPKEKAAESIFSMFSSQKTATAGILARILGWIFKIVLASAGLMVAGDLINKYVLNRSTSPSAPAAAKQMPMPVSTQKKFPPQSSYKEVKRAGWSLNIPNNPTSIENMLISFAKKVYQGLDGLENTIKSTAGFQVIKNRIVNYNQSSEGDFSVDIPKYFTSEKHIVDFFIDEVAENTK